MNGWTKTRNDCKCARISTQTIRKIENFNSLQKLQYLYYYIYIFTGLNNNSKSKEKG